MLWHHVFPLRVFFLSVLLPPAMSWVTVGTSWQNHPGDPRA